jgi:Transglycosylase associated protein
VGNVSPRTKKLPNAIPASRPSLSPRPGSRGRFLGWYQEGQAAGFIMSVAGAIILLLNYRLIRKKSA